MKIEITATPQFHMPLTAKDVQLLRELAAIHYDGVCKAAGAVGGFLYGWSNMLNLTEGAETTTVPASLRQVDTTLKILEMRTVLHGRADDRALAMVIDADLRSAWNHWRECAPHWRVSFDTAEDGATA